MKKQKVNYRLKHFYYNNNFTFYAKREIPFEIHLASKLMLDTLCFNWNKARLLEKINDSIDRKDKETFQALSKIYSSYLWED